MWARSDFLKSNAHDTSLSVWDANGEKQKFWNMMLCQRKSPWEFIGIWRVDFTFTLFLSLLKHHLSCLYIWQVELKQMICNTLHFLTCTHSQEFYFLQHCAQAALMWHCRRHVFSRPIFFLRHISVLTVPVLALYCYRCEGSRSHTPVSIALLRSRHRDIVTLGYVFLAF